MFLLSLVAAPGFLPGHLFINCSTRTNRDDLNICAIGPVNDSMPADAQTPQTFEISFKPLTTVGIFQ